MKELFSVFMENKKGDAAMVATVLLVLMAVTAGILVTSFSQKSTESVSQKITDIGSSVECNDIRLSLRVGCSEPDLCLFIKNTGTLGVNKVVLRKYGIAGNVFPDEINTFNGDEKFYPGEEVQYNGLPRGFVRVEAKPIFTNEEGELFGCNDFVYEE